MEKILYLAHTETDGQLGRTALEALSAALQLTKDLEGSSLAVGLVGGEIQAAADAVAACGASEFVAVSGPDFESSRYGSDTAALEAICRKTAPTIVVAPATSRLCRSLPGVAVRLEGKIDTRITGMEATGGKLTVQRWYYRQRMVATLSRQARPWFLLLEAGVFPAWQGDGGVASVEALDVMLPDRCKRTRVEGQVAPTSEAQTIRPEADLLFVAGAGWTKKQADGAMHTQEAANLILNLLERAKASLGSSKSLVDQSSEGQAVLPFMSHLNQVGQTGSTPRHPKGLATCCHGEEPHVVGWRFIRERRAVNTDASCGWAQGKADVLYVADAFKVVAEINRLLAEG